MEEIILKSNYDGYELCLHVFKGEDSKKGCVQFVHGMEEHQERYEALAELLVSQGFSVVTSDMRGHGKNAPKLGYFETTKGEDALVQDQRDILSWIKDNLQGPYYLFAHSMGTIISRVLLQFESNSYKKVILSGYPNYQSGCHFGKFLTKVMSVKKHGNYFSKGIEKMAVGAFNKSVKNPKTDFDWLSYNEKNVQFYIDDPYCGHGFMISSFHALFSLMAKMKKNYSGSKELKILLLSGEDDPCTGGTKGRKKSMDILNKQGYNDIQEIVYPNMRHEILNEKFEIVSADIVNFLLKETTNEY